MTATRPSLSFEGKVAKLRIEHEGVTSVIVTFVLRQDDGTVKPVEMRGEQLRGVLNEGDRVLIAEGSNVVDAQDATLHPSALTNLSTQGTVEVWRPSRSKRILRSIGVGEVKSAAISATVGGVVAVALSNLLESAAGGPQAPPGETPSESSDAFAVLVGLTVVFVLTSGVWLFAHRITSTRLPKWSVVIGLGVGLIVLGVPLGLAVTSE